MRRRDFIKVIGGSASIWPFAARAQQATIPLIGFLGGRSPNQSEALVAAFRQAWRRPIISRAKMSISLFAGQRVDMIGYLN